MTDSDVNHFDYSVDTITTTLLERARLHDNEAWDRLVFLFGPLVYKWCRAKGLQPAEARDIGQEVFQAVAAKLHEFRRDREGDTFRGWLRVITNNKMHDAWRRQAERRAHEQGGESLGMLALMPYREMRDDEESRREDAEDVYKRILDYVRETVNPEHWDIFLRVVIHDERPAAVAESLDKKRSYIDTIKARVLAKLRTEFGEGVTYLGPTRN